LFLFVIAFLIYADGIGTIIEIAAIYGAELGFGSTQLVLALLMVQFVGIPFSLIFGRLPDPKEKRRPFFLAFVLYNLVILPLVGISSRLFLPAELSGIPPAAYQSTAAAAGQGIHPVTQGYTQQNGEWQVVQVSAEQLGASDGASYLVSAELGARLDFAFNGQDVVLYYSTGPDHGIWDVFIDGQPLVEEETGEPLSIDTYHPTLRYEVEETFHADTAGEHSLTIVNTGQVNPESQGTLIAISAVEVLPPQRQSSLLLVIGLILAVEVIGLVLCYFLGPLFFSRLADKFTTKNSILLALSVYAMIAIWGFFLDSVIEYWFLAWMVAVVQGGSQALSRSLFSSMSPAAKSGEFFGLFGIMEKFSAILGPLLFAFAVGVSGSSRPAVLGLVSFFIIGGYLLTRVNVEEGRRVARQEDAALLEQT
jgi:MFS family permease